MTEQELDKLGFVNVKDFGATGDGVTDDSDAVQAAVDEAARTGKEIIRFPIPGTYRLAKGVNFSRKECDK